MRGQRPQPPCPQRIRSIRGSFSWIDHRFLRQSFDQGLTRLEKLLYFVLIAVSNRDGVSFYSDERLSELLLVHYPHELAGARAELVARGLIAFQDGLYQVLELPARPLPPGQYQAPHPAPSGSPPASPSSQSRTGGWRSVQDLLGLDPDPDDD